MAGLTYLLFSLAIGVALGQQPKCLQGWLSYGESCYGFGEAAVTWGDAEEMCRSYDARLVEIETKDENDWLKTNAANKGGYSYWIGGTDVFHEGVWEWVSTRKTIYPFTDWKQGEPNDEKHHEDCLSLVSFAGYKWNDWPCDSKYDFICEATPLDIEIG